MGRLILTLPFAYKGEAMLLRWSETPKGRTVTLLLDPHEGEQHPFKSLKCGENGQRMQIAAVLVGDDDKPVPPSNNSTARRATENGSDSPGASGTASQPHADKAEGQDKPRTPFRDMKRSAQAALKCQDEAFQEFVLLPLIRLGHPYPFPKMDSDTENADAAIKYMLGITSKRELDTDEAAGKRWLALLTDFEFRNQVRQ